MSLNLTAQLDRVALKKSDITLWRIVGEVSYAVRQRTVLAKKWGRGLERLRDHDDLGLARRQSIKFVKTS